MFRAPSLPRQTSARIGAEIGLPQHIRALPLQQQLAFQRQRHQEAYDRLHGGATIQDGDGQRRTYIMYHGGSDSDDDDYVPQIQRIRVTGRSNVHDRMIEGEHSVTDFFLFTIYFLRCHLKLLVLIAIIVYFKEVSQAQAESRGWFGTRKIGFKQRDLCTSTGDAYAYGVLEYEWYEFAKKIGQQTALVIEVDVSASTLLKPCMDEGTIADLASLLQDTEEYKLEKFNSQDYLESGISNAGAVRGYFPGALGIQLCAYAAALLTLALETLPRTERNAINLNLSESEKNVVVRANHVMCIILCTLLFVSSASYSLLQEESCTTSFGISASGGKGNPNNANQNDLMKDALTMCAETDKLNVILASVINPSEPYVRVYSSFTTALSIILIAGTLVKPDLNSDRGNAQEMSSLVPRALRQLLGAASGAPGARRRERLTRNRQVLVDGTNNNTNVGLAVEFMRRYSDVARRNKITKDWKLLEKPTGDVSVEEKERCCTICLDLLFPDEIDEKLSAGGAGAGNSTISSSKSQSGTKSDADQTPQSQMQAQAQASELDAAVDSSTKIKPDQLNTEKEKKQRLQNEIVFSLPCGHKYHKPCILEWAFKNTTCPECRASLDTGLPESAARAPTERPDYYGSPRHVPPNGDVDVDVEEDTAADREDQWPANDIDIDNDNDNDVGHFDHSVIDHMESGRGYGHQEVSSAAEDEDENEGPGE